MNSVLFLLFALIVTTFACGCGKPCDNPCDDPCNPCNKIWKVIIVGGGGSGISQTYLFDLHKKLNEQAGANLTHINMTDILIIEEKDILGGDAISTISQFTNSEGQYLSNKLYGYDGPWFYDEGPQRIPQLTARLERSLAVSSNTITEYMHYDTVEYNRGRQLNCPDPEFQNYSPSGPYGIGSSCTIDKVFIGDNSIPWSYSNGIGPAFDLSGIQPWAYQQDPLELMNLYILYGGANPVTCVDAYIFNGVKWIEKKDCAACGECFLPNDSAYKSNTCSKYHTVQAALIGQLNHELFETFVLDYAGFYADFRIGLHNPCQWASSYWPREWDTNGINGYPVGGFRNYLVDHLGEPISNKGTIITGEKVISINSVGGRHPIRVKTDNGNKYTGDFLIYAAQPENLLNGAITGNFVEDIISQEEFKSVYSVPTVSVTVEMENPFWYSLLPDTMSNPNTTKWVQLRGFGDIGCISRIEFRNSVYGSAVKAARLSYTDLACVNTWSLLLKENEANESGVQEKIYRQLRDDIIAGFAMNPSDIDKWEDSEMNIEMELFENGWYYLFSNTTSTSVDVKEWAAKPLGDHVPVCFAQEAWDYEYLGWVEAGMRPAQKCMERIIPKSSELLECYMYELFPPCPQKKSDPGGDIWPLGVDCYSNPDAHILGTETIIPSPYCSERWFPNNFVEKYNCVDDIVLTRSKYNRCLHRNAN